MHYTMRTQTLREQPTAVRRATLPADQVGSWLADTYAQVAAYLERAGVPMSGPPYARYVLRDHEMEVEAGFPVADPIAGDGQIEPSGLPAGPVAVSTHYGPYETLAEAGTRPPLLPTSGPQVGGSVEIEDRATGELRLR